MRVVIYEVSKGPYVWCAVCGKQAGPAMDVYVLQFMGIDVTVHLRECLDIVRVEIDSALLKNVRPGQNRD